MNEIIDDEPPSEINNEGEKSELTKILLSKAIKIYDEYLFPGFKGAYMINDQDFIKFLDDFDVKLIKLNTIVSELDLPLFVFDFDRGSVKVIGNELFTEYNKFPSMSENASILYSFAKFRLDKNYLEKNLSLMYH